MEKPDSTWVVFLELSVYGNLFRAYEVHTVVILMITWCSLLGILLGEIIFSFQQKGQVHVLTKVNSQPITYLPCHKDERGRRGLFFFFILQSLFVC